MEKKIQPDKPVEIPPPDKKEEIVPVIDPEEPLVIVPEEMPDIIPDDEPFETPPYEMAPFGEGPWVDNFFWQDEQDEQDVWLQFAGFADTPLKSCLLRYRRRNPMLGSLAKIHSAEKDILLEQLLGVIGHLQRAGIISMQRTCFSCRFYQKTVKRIFAGS